MFRPLRLHRAPTLARLLAALGIVGLLVGLGAAPVHADEQRLTFAGGPDGGTFQLFSGGIATLVSRHVEGVTLSNLASAGSVENLRRVNAREADFGIVYAGDLYLGGLGQLSGDSQAYRNGRVMAFLYGAPAHLLVLADSGIGEVGQLVGKRVAVGPTGSGAATSAQRFFESLGLWGQIRPQFIGYNQGAAALGDRQIDALWVFAGFPNASVTQAATSHPIRLLQVWESSQQGTLPTAHPYYSKVRIPAGTYPGVDYDVDTISDGALWIAGRHLPADLAYRIIGEVYSPRGLAVMHGVSPAAAAMTIDSGLDGVVTPVHDGAKRFWTGHGKTLTTLQAQ